MKTQKKFFSLYTQLYFFIHKHILTNILYKYNQQQVHSPETLIHTQVQKACCTKNECIASTFMNFREKGFPKEKGVCEWAGSMQIFSKVMLAKPACPVVCPQMINRKIITLKSPQHSSSLKRLNGGEVQLLVKYIHILLTSFYLHLFFIFRKKKKKKIPPGAYFATRNG